MRARPDYLLIGHITADLTLEGRFLGGTASYSSRTASAFGMRVGVLTSAASAAGQTEPLLNKLTPYAELEVVPAQATSTFENIYGPNGRIQYIRSVAAPLTASDVPPEWLSAPLVHLAPLTDEVDPQIAHAFKDSVVLLTLQGWLRRWDADGRVRFKRWFDPEVLQDIDIVVFSEEDVAEAPELEQEFAGVVKHLLVTRAERGGTYYHQGQPLSYTSPQVQMVHPTGAGDIFAASLLASLHVLNGDMVSAVQVAAQLASISVTRIGLESAPRPDEVRQALAEIDREGN